MTSRRIPRAGEKYRHFNGNAYQIITIAKDSETLAPVVVYQGLYGDFETFVRPMAEFISEVDRTKYPDAIQQYRFEPIEPSEPVILEPVRPGVPYEQPVSTAVYEQPVSQAAPGPVRASEPVSTGFKTSADITDWMMRFFDADDFDEKYSILKAMKTMEGLTDNIIDNMAATLDYVIDDGDIDDRFAQLMKCVDTRRRFESGRLR